MRQGPLAGRSPAVAGMVDCALVPYLALSGALGPITPLIAGRLHMSLQTMSIGSGLGNSPPAPGAVARLPCARVLRGWSTSLLLISAAPPLFLGFPRSKLRPTAMIMNMCIFGAVALGPLIGGIQAGAHRWRSPLWIVAALARDAPV